MPGEVHVDLSPEEEKNVELAVAKRRREFVAARWCVRRGLEGLGLEPLPVPNDARRAPIWPSGVVGSISHTAGYCAVVVASAADLASVGLDVERDAPVGEHLWERICTPGERQWLDRWPPEERGRWVRIVFSAKESFYKCQYQLTETFLGFHDARLWLEPDARRYEVELLRDVGPFARSDRLAGGWVEPDGLLATGMWLDRVRDGSNPPTHP